jgi:MFS superfamily sulfate permease-like transporter
MLGMLIFDTLPGLLIGIAISLALLLYRVSRPRVAVLGRVPGTADQYGDVERHPENEPPAGVAVLRVESGLFFANAEHVRTAVRGHVTRDTGAIVLDAETVPYIDVSAARMIGELADDLERDGVILVIARDVGQVRDVPRRADPGHAPVHAFPTVQGAVDAVSSPGGLPPPRRAPVAPHPAG